MKTQYQAHQEAQKEAKKDLAKQIAGVLSALIPVLTILGINLEWLTEEFVQQFYVLMVAVAALAYNVYAIYKNHFSGKHAQKQNEELKRKGLK